ncbi:MAG: hypothetical protein H6679_00795 [Epsilonproteobacteria bacterium]|nr:hypothetical protein [Campylobacterota bacterium]
MKKQNYSLKNLVFFSALYCATTLFYTDLQPSSAQPKEWTILVYVQANNNLASFASKNFTDMAEIGSNQNLNIAIQWYQPHDQGFWRYKINKGKMELDVRLPTTSDGNSDKDLSDAMRWAVNKYPAKNYGLILWDHGIGVLDPAWGRLSSFKKDAKIEEFVCNLDPEMVKNNPRIQIEGLTIEEQDKLFTPQQRSPLFVHSSHHENEHRGILFNEYKKTYMDNQTLCKALSDIHKNVLKNKKIDLLGMDACLMAMLEIAYQARHYASYLVSSQEVELGYGWSYTPFMHALAHSKATPTQAAQAIVTAYEGYYKNKIGFYTQSAIDLEKTINIRENLDALVEKIKLCQATNKSVINNVINQARKASLQFSAQSYVDLHSFYQELFKLLSNKDVTQEIKQANDLKTILTQGLQSIEQAVIANAAGNTLSRAKGISIYFPRHHIDDSYQKIEFAKESKWLHFIKELLPSL